MNKYRLIGFYLLATLMATLTACGGGSGDNALDLPSVSDFQLQIALLAQDNDTDITVVTNAAPGRLRITLLDPDDNPAADQTISLIETNVRLEFNSVQSDENGIVELTVFAGRDGPAEASISAEYTDSEGDLAQAEISFETLGDEPDPDFLTPVTDTEFDIGATLLGSFRVGELDIGAAAGSTLAAYSTTSITAELRNFSGELITTPTTVNFSSPCALDGKTELSAAVSSINGIAVATYRAVGCAGSDNVTATASTATTTITASAIVVVSSAPASSLQFMGATPDNIAIKGAGGAARQDFSILEFLVTDSSNNPVSAQEVEFTLEGVGSFEDGSIATTALSNEDGGITISVFSGTVPGNISVEASFPEGQVKVTIPGALSVSGGLPHQDGLTLSITSLNPNAYNYANIENQINIQATDRFSNAVPDGTTITFVAEAGIIESPCSTINGFCSVSWYSPGGSNGNAARAPRNPDEPFDRNGRVAVLAYMSGEESFSDEDSNGLFSYRMIDTNDDGIDDGIKDTVAPEFFTNIPEAFLDRDENGVQSGIDGAFEEYIDYNDNGQHDSEDELFQGVNCDDSIPAEGHCSDTLNIFVTSSFVMSSDHIFFEVYESTMIDDVATWTLIEGTPVLTGAENFLIGVFDENGNSPPEGTKVSVTIDGALLGSTVEHTIFGGTEPYYFEITVSPEADPVPSSQIGVDIIADIEGITSKGGFDLIYPEAPAL